MCKAIEASADLKVFDPGCMFSAVVEDENCENAWPPVNDRVRVLNERYPPASERISPIS
jgi:hypothetical protein